MKTRKKDLGIVHRLVYRHDSQELLNSAKPSLKL